MPLYPPEVIDTLAIKNAHERDPNIEFDPEPHIYTVNRDPSVKYTSVTTWNHSHFEPFDADAIIDKMFRSRRWGPTNKYWGMTAEQIKAGWAQNAKEASEAGTDMHFRIECFHNMVLPADILATAPNGKPTYRILLDYYNATYARQSPKTQLSQEWSYFLSYVADHPDFVPYRTEWMVYYEELQLSGSIDMIYENADGTLSIYDWKRAKEIKQDDSYGKCATTTCIKHLPDTNYWHYTLQLNIYKMILETKYGKRITDLCLVVLHPGNFNGGYLLYPVPTISKEIRALCKYRARELSEGVPSGHGHGHGHGKIETVEETTDYSTCPF
jgi:hypothetical protein